MVQHNIFDQVMIYFCCKSGCLVFLITNVFLQEVKLKREVTRLEKEASSARSEARAAEARALQLQRLVDAQAE